MLKENLPNDEAVLVLTREFEAPRELVFQACADGEALSEWWRPMGYRMTVLTIDFQPGGLFHYKMESPERTMYGRLRYGRIVKPSLIEFTLSFADEHGGIIRAPFFDPWPLEIFNVLTLSENGKKTILSLKSYPVSATAAEIASYKANKNSFRQGLTYSIDRLALILMRKS